MSKNGLSENTYSDIFWSLDGSVRCRDTIDPPTEVDVAIVALREDFLNRVTGGKSMRLPLDRRENGRLECMEDILRNGHPVVAERALPFRHRRVPEIHLRWLREQIKTRGLSNAVSLER